MDLDDLKDRYKELPKYGRVLCMVFFGLLPAAYIYTEDVDILSENLEASKSQVISSKSKFEIARTKKKRLPELEVQLKVIQNELSEAKKVLPQNFGLATFLKKTAVIAKKNNLSYTSFIPGKEIVCLGSKFKYLQKIVNAKVTGKFRSVTNFFDQIAHFKSSVIIKDININRATSENIDEDENDTTEVEEKSPKEVEALKYKNMRIEAAFVLYMYKSKGELDDKYCNAVANEDEEVANEDEEVANDSDVSESDDEIEDTKEDDYESQEEL